MCADGSEGALSYRDRVKEEKEKRGGNCTTADANRFTMHHFPQVPADWVPTPKRRSQLQPQPQPQPKTQRAQQAAPGDTVKAYVSLPESTDSVQDLDWALRMYGLTAQTGKRPDIRKAPSQVAVSMYHTLDGNPAARVKMLEAYLKQSVRVQEKAGDAEIEGAKTLKILHAYRDSLVEDGVIAPPAHATATEEQFKKAEKQEICG